MDIGTGTTITFESGFLAEILDVSPPNASREPIPTSHMGTANNAHTFTPAKLVDWGELNCQIGFAPGTSPPITSAASEIVITFPNSGASTWTFNGFLTSYEPTDPLENRMEAAVTIKVTGPVTISA